MILLRGHHKGMLLPHTHTDQHKHTDDWFTQYFSVFIACTADSGRCVYLKPKLKSGLLYNFYLCSMRHIASSASLPGQEWKLIQGSSGARGSMGQGCLGHERGQVVLMLCLISISSVRVFLWNSMMVTRPGRLFYLKSFEQYLFQQQHVCQESRIELLESYISVNIVKQLNFCVVFAKILLLHVGHGT